MKHCKHCNEELKIGVNWIQSNKNNSWYICKSCQKEYNSNYRKSLIDNTVYGIYIKDKLIYIGSTTRFSIRKLMHLDNAKHSERKLYKLINKYGLDMRPLYTNLISEAQLRNTEKFMIEHTNGLLNQQHNRS